MATQTFNRPRPTTETRFERVPRGRLEPVFSDRRIRHLAGVAVRQYVGLIPAELEQQLREAAMIDRRPRREAALKAFYALRSLELETDLVSLARERLLASHAEQAAERAARKQAKNARNLANRAARAEENRARARANLGGKKKQ